MRKAIVLVMLVLLSVMTVVPGLAESDAGILNDDAAQDAPIGIQRGEEVVIASPIAMSGQFGTELFGNNAADMDVRALISGYETVSITGDMLKINETVVSRIQVSQAEGGTVAYRLKIADNLTYNDGSPITASDYAFYFLLSGAPQIAEIGGTPLPLTHIAGYAAYLAGETDVISGVSLLPGNEIEIRIIGASLPYFYGAALLRAKPYPISVIAPGCTVKDDGQGAYISGEFTPDMLRRTLLDTETGYQYFPKVTSGAYSLEGRDAEALEARFVVNERFQGNHEGQKPHIERVVFRYGGESRLAELLKSGEADIVNKATDGARLIGQIGDAADFQQFAYLRTGLAFLAFACEAEPTNSAAVRGAIARSFDKDAYVMAALPGTAMRTYGYYGLGQWMATFIDEKDADAPLDAATELSALDVPMDVARAIALLEEDGWTLNRDQEPFDGARDDVRYRLKDGELQRLMIRCAVPSETKTALEIKSVLEAAFKTLGIALEVDVMPFSELLEHYYRQSQREYGMFYMGTNFNYIYDPYYDFNTQDIYQGSVNTTGLKDEALMQLAREMRETEAEDMRGYVKKWLAFQRKFTELMPLLPLYSNTYFDIVNEGRIAGYNIAANVTWADAILYAYVRVEPQ